MKSTLDVCHAVHNGEPVTEEELRLCIMSMRATLVLHKLDLARWATDKNLPPMVRMKAQATWEEMNNRSWTAPLEKRIPPEDRPGHPDREDRKRVAEKVFAKATAGTKYVPCTCCENAERYNGFGSDGPTLFTCPKSCSCHD